METIRLKDERIQKNDKHLKLKDKRIDLLMKTIKSKDGKIQTLKRRIKTSQTNRIKNIKRKPKPKNNK